MSWSLLHLDRILTRKKIDDVYLQFELKKSDNHQLNKLAIMYIFCRLGLLLPVQKKFLTDQLIVNDYISPDKYFITKYGKLPDQRLTLVIDNYNLKHRIKLDMFEFMNHLDEFNVIGIKKYFNNGWNPNQIYMNANNYLLNYYLDASNTPLVIEKRFELAKLFLMFGADPNLQYKDSEGLTGGILNYIWDLDDPNIKENKGQYIKLVELLIDYGINIDQVDNEGMSSFLQLVSTYCNYLIYINTDHQFKMEILLTYLKFLLEHEASVNLQNKLGQSALHIITINQVSRGGISYDTSELNKILDVLYQFKINPRLQDKNGKIALDYLQVSDHPIYSQIKNYTEIYIK